MARLTRIRPADIMAAIAVAKDAGLHISEMIIEPTAARLVFGVASPAESAKDTALKQWP